MSDATLDIAQKLCRDGVMMFNRRDFYIGRSLELYGEYSAGESALFRDFVTPGMIVVDAGANIGAHTLLLSQLAGGSGRVLAFEPQRLVFQLLCGNCALNGLANVFAYHAMLSDESGERPIAEANFARSGNFGGYAVAEMPGAESDERLARVRSLRLDDLDLPACGFIKIDVEGMERQVLEGAAATIGRHRPVLLVESDRADKHEALCRMLQERLHYRLHWHITRLFNPENFLANKVNVFGGAASCNMLCLPEECDRRSDLPEVSAAVSAAALMQGG